MRSFLPPEIAKEIEAGSGSVITGFTSASGGCINQGGTVRTKKGSFFLKWNDRNKYPGMFQAEANGLSLLRRSTSLHVPRVVGCGVAGSYQFLILDLIEESNRGKAYWTNLGVGLAQLHRTPADQFGLDHDNYIGSLPQSNTPTYSWLEFFAEQRLKKLLKLAVDSAKLDMRVSKKFDLLFNKLAGLLIIEPPSLLHGDLWSGNIMTNAYGEASLIDPAVYYGNREVDLAMTRLFGGFDPAFLESYDDAYPLEPGYDERFDLYNLYPLLVHVNLFGGGYARQAELILDQFV